MAQLAKASMISWATQIGAVPGSIPESKLTIIQQDEILRIPSSNWMKNFMFNTLIFCKLYKV